MKVYIVSEMGANNVTADLMAFSTMEKALAYRSSLFPKGSENEFLARHHLYLFDELEIDAESAPDHSE